MLLGLNLYEYSISSGAPPGGGRPILRYLQPLGAVIVQRSPSVGLALLVEPSEVRVPGEGVHVPGAEGAGGRNLAVGDHAGFHSQGLRATCRV